MRRIENDRSEVNSTRRNYSSQAHLIAKKKCEAEPINSAAGDPRDRARHHQIGQQLVVIGDRVQGRIDLHVKFFLKNRLLYGHRSPAYGDFNSEQSETFFFCCEAQRPVSN